MKIKYINDLEILRVRAYSWFRFSDDFLLKKINDLLAHVVSAWTYRGGGEYFPCSHAYEHKRRITLLPCHSSSINLFACKTFSGRRLMFENTVFAICLFFFYLFSHLLHLKIFLRHRTDRKQNAFATISVNEQTCKLNKTLLISRHLFYFHVIFRSRLTIR